ncbi:MAG: response regulator [Acidobacteria bacterium]|nr:MAG: response regulator [Acidobacteriota bacterium]
MGRSDTMNDRKKSIVLIDDDLQILQTARKLLEQEGFEVHTRNSGFESTNFIAKQNPDLVLLDVNMPFLSGDCLAEIFKTNPQVKGIPIVLFSSNDENTLRKMVMETGALGYISKSEMGAAFAQKVTEFIRRAPRNSA